MNRTTFLFFIIIISLICNSCNQNSGNNATIKFGICTDVHKDIMYDADDRLQEFISDMSEQQVDFIIELGDFCFPKPENNDFLKIWNSFTGPSYHVLGNHDMDISSKQVTIEYLDMKSNYYSFNMKGFHFVVLDPNNFIDSTVYVPYNNSNYYKHAGTRGIIPPEQLSWLHEDLAETEHPTIVFSHQSLYGKSTRRNVAEVREILENANDKAGFTKVIACINGHTHSDKHTEINGIHYIQVNSMSYQWLGSDYAYPDRYPEEINEKYPSLKYTAPYKDPLYAIVEIQKGDYIKTEGRQTEWVSPSPTDLGYTKKEDTIPFISSRSIALLP